MDGRHLRAEGDELRRGGIREARPAGLAQDFEGTGRHLGEVADELAVQHQHIMRPRRGEELPGLRQRLLVVGGKEALVAAVLLLQVDEEECHAIVGNGEREAVGIGHGP